MDEVIKKLSQLVVEPLEKMEVVVDEIYFYEKNKNGFLTVVVDKAGGIDLDTVVEVSKVISSILDEIDKNEDNYILDVISKERGEENE